MRQLQFRRFLDNEMPSTAKEDPVDRRRINNLSLNSLLLDENNPRFGLQEHGNGQEQILDHIVTKFGVDDVLSSLAVNGYFESEPLVCRRVGDSDKFVVLEGNRRLAACLILVKDQRAKDHEARTTNFRKLWAKSGSPSIDPVPAIVFEESEQEKVLLSYLGVRHIASSQPWDSYAKAAWVAQVVETGELDVESVAKMIGDQHRTISRLLQGYYVVQQLIEARQFKPQDSVRRGRGSVTEYPFSWVYTMLGYASVQEFLQISADAAARRPIPPEKLSQGGLLLKSMFGDRSRGRNASVEDSRELSLLASVLASTEKVLLLEQGKTVREILALTQPLSQRLSDSLNYIREMLRDLNARLSEKDIEKQTAETLLPLSGDIRRATRSLDDALREIAYGRDADS